MILLNFVGRVLHTCTVSISLLTISSRWVVRAAPSIAIPVPSMPTRSVMSKMMDVKPSLSRKTSWWSGTWRMVLFPSISTGHEEGGEPTHLTSAKLLGRSTIRAPPKSGVLVKVVIFYRVWLSF